jgi:hypothetical protein
MPRVSDFAEHLKAFLEEYTAEVASTHGPQACCCVLVGWDHAANAPSASMITARSDHGSLRVDHAFLDVGADSTPHFVGSSAAEARARLLAYDSAKHHGVRARKPLQMIRGALREGAHEHAGGGVQIGRVGPDGFELYFDMQPTVPGAPLANMRYRGFDFTKVNTVGSAFVNLAGVA